MIAPELVARNQLIRSSSWGNVVRQALLDLDAELTALDSLVTTVKARVTSTEAPALTSDTGALIVGPIAGAQLAIGANSVQSKSNATTAALLDLNPLGGSVRTGGAILPSAGDVQLYGNGGGIGVINAVRASVNNKVALYGRTSAGADTELMTLGVVDWATGRFFDRNTYVATVGNGGTGTLTHTAHWSKFGNVVRVAWSMNFTGAGAAGTLTVSLPFNFGGNSGQFEVVGSGYWYDVSTGGPHIPLSVRRSGSAHAVEFVYSSATALLGSALGNGDAVGFVATYEWI